MLRLAVLCIVLVSAWADHECNTAGTAGVMCAGRYCPAEENECVDDMCVCPVRGQPELLCANDEDFFASCVNDPNAFSMNNREEAGVHSPCMYLFSHVRVKVKSNRSPKGKCEVWVNLNNQRVRGKLYVGGFEVRVKCKKMSSDVGDQDNVYKVDSFVDMIGEYCFRLRVSNDGGETFHEDLQSASSKIDLAPYTFKVDPTTNRVKLQIPAVGVTAQLRPFDPAFNVFNQKWLPGFAVKYDADKDPYFKSKDSVVSLVPGTTLDDAANPYFDHTDELTFRAFTGPGNKKRDFPNWTNKCKAVKNTLNDCPNDQRAANAMKQCRFALAKALFVNCYSEPASTEVDSMLALYKKCVEAFCQKDSTLCNEVKDDLNGLDADCKAHVPGDMLTHSCVFP